MRRQLFINVFLLIVSALVIGCSAQRRLMDIKDGKGGSVSLSLGNEPDYLPEVKMEKMNRDTIKIIEDDGREILFMKAVKDEETGEMVASDVIDAAMVSARFRNVAERQGKVNLVFQVSVPESMMDSKWQLRLYPDLLVLEDSVRLDPVIITGNGYRKAQLKGYQQYERFLSRIIQDSTKFINVRALEIFLRRNIPQVYAFKSDPSEVSDERFYSVFGVSERQAVEHYTNNHAMRMNERRKSRKDKMYGKYVKAPIVTEGVRLDSVIVSPDGDFVYNYVQTINARPKLRRADIVLSGEIFEQGRRVYSIPRSKPLTFYISSVSTLADNTERYLTKVVERRASANTECRIDFDAGKAEVRPDLGDNFYGIRRIRMVLGSIIENKEFDIDSVLVQATASPEGSWRNNAFLAQRRSESVSAYFRTFIDNYADSLRAANGVVIDFDSGTIAERTNVQTIRFTPRCIPENWDDFYKMIERDPVLNVDQKSELANSASIPDPDDRERMFRDKAYYKYLSDVIYPRLRTVKFKFCLHRKGMVKDTVHTTVVDSVYMRGVRMLKDMDYSGALFFLSPYKDFNTAVACIGLERNKSARDILEKMERGPEVNYLLAILYSREGEAEKAVQCYLASCRRNRGYVYRGNLDPEISELIKTYGLNREDEKIDY